jgi:hypothetical protein
MMLLELSVSDATIWNMTLRAGITKEGSTTVPLTSCLTHLESAVLQLTIFVFICKAG